MYLKHYLYSCLHARLPPHHTHTPFVSYNSCVLRADRRPQTGSRELGVSGEAKEGAPEISE